MERGNLEQILIVDDEEALVRLMTDTLVELGYVPVSFTQAQRRLPHSPHTRNASTPSSRTSECPAFPGVELIRSLRAIRPTVPVVMVSGYLGSRNRPPGT